MSTKLTRKQKEAMKYVAREWVRLNLAQLGYNKLSTPTEKTSSAEVHLNTILKLLEDRKNNGSAK